METPVASEARPAEPMPVTPAMRAVAWGILSVIGLITSIASLLLLMAQLESGFGLSHAAMLGLWTLTSTLLAGALAYAAARATLGTWPEPRPWALILLAAGALVAGAQMWLLTDWMIAVYGYSDPEYVGPVFGLFAVVAGVAVAGFGVQIGPAGSRWPAVLGVAFGSFLAVGEGLTYLPSLLDGIAPSTVAPALASVAAVGYIGVVVGATLWKGLRPASR